MKTPLSVTVLTGSPGTDGARTFERIVNKSGDLRIAAIVPRGEQQSQSSSQYVSMLPTTEKLARLGEGCSCCTVRSDLMSKIERIAAEQSADHIVIQASLSCDLVTLAKTFTVANASGAVLSEVARIEGLVAVVDAPDFLATLKTEAARAIIERIALANIIVLERESGLEPAVAARVRTALEALNSRARIMRGDEESFGLSSLRVERPVPL